MLAKLKKKIRASHSDDREQLKVIFTNEKRVIVEAPAGCGKTKTMISRVAYLLAAEKVPFPKKILALTFSVNAAYKIKKDVAEKVPDLLASARISPVVLKNRVLATNYHGFCRRVLRLYGYLIDPNLRNIETIQAVDDAYVDKLTKLGIGLSYEQAYPFTEFNKAVKTHSGDYLLEHRDQYIEGVRNLFLSKNHIPFNAILILAMEIFRRHPEILRYYQKLFPVVIIDEFQDTNILSWWLINEILTEDASFMFMGDPLQRIYGFIGALPNLMDYARKKLEMKRFELVTNYRFKDNEHLLLVDRNIRENAKDPRSPAIEEMCLLKVLQGDDQPAEAKLVFQLTQELHGGNGAGKVAILTKQRGSNINMIMDTLGSKGLPFFYALFGDDDPEYIGFHRDVLKHFTGILEIRPGSFNRNVSKRLQTSVKKEYKEKKQEIYRALLRLLDVFLDVVFTEYAFLDIGEKIDFVRDTLESRSLKQYLEYVDSNIIVSTVHGAKGLEWDYVIIPDMEQYLFPNWPGLCGICKIKFDRDCFIDWSKIPKGGQFEKQFYDELSIFYVAATRARKDLYFTLSEVRYDSEGNEKDALPSCFLSLEGFSIA